MDVAVQQDDVGDGIHITHVVATKNSTHMVAIVGCDASDVKKYLDEAIRINTVTTTIHILNVSCIVAAIDGDIDKDVFLDGKVGDVAILHIGIRA